MNTAVKYLTIAAVALAAVAVANRFDVARKLIASDK
jgi:hypothetical protein